MSKRPEQTKETARTPYQCKHCGRWHGNYQTHAEHRGRCPQCLQLALEETRQSMECYRCGGDITELDTRHLVCLRCTLILARDGNDRIQDALSKMESIVVSGWAA